MKILHALLITLFLSSPALAGPWITVGTYELSQSATSTTIELGEQVGKFDHLRFQIEGNAVKFTSFKVVPTKGDTITLHVPEYLKAGESSGLINIPAQATTYTTIDIEYSIPSAVTSSANMTLRIKKN